MKTNYFLSTLIVPIVFISFGTATFAENNNNTVEGIMTANTTAPATTTVIKPTGSATSVESSTTGITTTVTIATDGTVTTTTAVPNPSNGSVTYTTTPPNGGTPAVAVRAANGDWSGDQRAIDAGKSVVANDGLLNTITSEMVPGADCMCYKDGKTTGAVGVACTGPVSERKYQCTSGKGLSGFQAVFAKLIRYVINIVLLLGVLAVVGLGIVWSFAGGDDVKMKSTLKTWAINIVVGLMILFMFRYILMFLAPWIYQ